MTSKHAIINNKIAVLTADIVNSTSLNKNQYVDVIQVLSEVLEETQQRFVTSFEIYRGDGFQVVYPNPANAMLSTLTIKLALRSIISNLPVELTQSLSVGHYEYLSDTPGKSYGDAFTISGRGLEKTLKGDISVHLDQKNLGMDLSLSTQFLNQLLRNLSNKQSLVAYHYLHQNYPEQALIADQLNMTRQNVATHLKRGSLSLIKAYISHFEALAHKYSKEVV